MYMATAAPAVKHPCSTVCELVEARKYPFDPSLTPVKSTCFPNRVPAGSPLILLLSSQFHHGDGFVHIGCICVEFPSGDVGESVDA